MKSELISIVVPVYNVDSFAEDCFQSLLGQSYQNLEIILVDDGSTDQSGAICDRYAEMDDRITVIHTENRGLSAARNRGVQVAAGRWISFVDSDDYAHPEMIEVLLSEAEKTHAQIAIGGTVTSSSDYREFAFSHVQTVHSEIRTCQRFLEDFLNNRTKKSVWGNLYRAELAKRTMFPEGRIYEDLPYHPMIMRTMPIVVWVDQVVYVQRINADSITHQKTNLKSCDRIRMKELQVQRIARYFPELEALAVGSLYADCMIWKLKADEAEDKTSGDALKSEIFRCMKLHPINWKIIKDHKLSFGRKASLLFMLLNFDAACRVKKAVVKIINRK